ncbi:MAG: hypothetical protein AUJ12_02535 [Alphaproteobacteria bacterium CG1_02_46_17]|nr:MAG: hypothetical protein AUJ12_02535 [Alphaproteobacteria bacterium CG1_02_46_17]
MSKEAITKTFFSQSAEAVDHAARTGKICRPYLKEARRAPELKNDLIEYGADPISLWIQHKKLSDKQTARHMGCTIPEYQALKNDSDGAFSKITTDLVLNFCHGLGVHPAHLGSLDDDFRQSLPPAVLAANIKIVEDQSDKYGLGDKQLAQYAISVEGRRYSRSFHDDCKFGRLAEKVDDLDAEDLTTLFTMASSLKYTPRLQAFSSLVCHHLIDEYQDHRDMSVTSQLSDARNITDKYTKLLSSGYGGLTELIPNGTPYALVKKFRTDERPPTQSDIRFELKRFAALIMQEDLNRIWSIGRKRELDIKWDFSALHPEIRRAASAVHAYVDALRKGASGIEREIENEKVIAEELQNLGTWHDRLHDNPEEAKVVGRLLVNRIQAHRLMQREQPLLLSEPAVK